MSLIRLMPLLLLPVQPQADVVGCWQRLHRPDVLPPAHCTIPGHLTNYWPFDESGDLLDSWQGQCDADCSVTATGMSTAAGVGTIAACPDVLIGETVEIGGYGVWGCNDAFGAPAYRNGPFFHERRGVWVMPFDLLWPGPTYELIWHWEIQS